MRFHSVRNKMMVSTFLLILICALVVIYICSQQMETHFFQYLQDPSALAGQGGQAAGGQQNGPLWNLITSPCGGSAFCLPEWVWW